MTRWKKYVYPFLCLLLAGITAFLFVQLNGAQTDCYTVCMYRMEWSDVYGEYITRRIEPMADAEWTSGGHDAEPVKVQFDGTVLRQGAGYGPTALRGAFSAEYVNAAYGQPVLTENWPFGWGVYFTNDWYVCDAYLAVELPQEPEGEAKATLTIYIGGDAKPVEVQSWSGKLGEPIIFGGLEI